jgi:hypothetical protein
MTSYAPKALRDALEVALEAELDGKSLEEFYRGSQRSSEAASTTSRSGWSGDHWTPDMPNAERELRRDLDALQHISAGCPRDQWRKIVAAIADRQLGSELGRDIARAWSLGGTILDVTFPKPNGDYTAEDFEACWRDACRNPHFGIGTVFHIAKEVGWTSSRKRWGLGRVQRPGKPHSAEALQVLEAALAMPRNNPNFERIAWYWKVLRSTRRGDLRDVAFVIAFSINIGSGFCWRTFESIASLLCWSRGKVGEGYRRVSAAVRDLALLDFIVRSPGNARGAHGRIGPSFALTLPDAMTWQACVAAYHADFGRSIAPSHEQPEMAATGTTQCGSKPKEEAETGTRSGGSQPNRNGSDQHQDSPVRAAPGMDQHQDMPVHLNMKIDAGGGEDKGPAAQARQAAATTPRDAEPASIGFAHDRPLPDGAPIDVDAAAAANGWTAETFWGPERCTEATHD